MAFAPPESLPFGATIDDEGVWNQVLTRVAGRRPRPALFLDRDGVVVEEVHYLHRVEETRLVAGAAAAVAMANRRSYPVILVTNQAGIGRGIYGWAEFAAVQEKLLDELADRGAFVNGVYACPHHAQSRAPYDVPDHPARKPNPGMLTRAARDFPIEMSASWIVGDRAGDAGAGRNAGLAGAVHVLSGHGNDEGERAGALAYRGARFTVRTADSIADAPGLVPLLDAAGEESDA